MVEVQRYDAHGRLFAVPFPPSEVALAIVLIFDHAHAVSAAIARARGNAFRHEVVTGILDEVVVTDAMIRPDAVAVFAAALADRLAGASVPRLEAAIACAKIRLCACAVGAVFGAKRRTVAVRVLLVTVFADANVGCGAYLVDLAN